MRRRGSATRRVTPTLIVPLSVLPRTKKRSALYRSLAPISAALKLNAQSSSSSFIHLIYAILYFIRMRVTAGYEKKINCLDHCPMPAVHLIDDSWNE